MQTAAEGWSFIRGAGLELLRCDALAEVPGVRHGFSTRRGPDGAAFDLGPSIATEPIFGERRRLLARALGLDGAVVLGPRQVHGNRIVDIEALEAEPGLEADAVVALRGTRAAPAVRVADCVPLLLADRQGRAVAAVHAGWRGTAAGIAGRAVAFLAERGIEPVGLVAALGPSIGPCCYEVGEDVLEAVARASGAGVGERIAPGKARLDLPVANRIQLEAAGLPGAAIRTARLCTRCNPGLLFSWRGEGAAAGRAMACIGWAAGAP